MAREGTVADNQKPTTFIGAEQLVEMVQFLRDHIQL